MTQALKAITDGSKVRGEITDKASKVRREEASRDKASEAREDVTLNDFLKIDRKSDENSYVVFGIMPVERN